MGTLAGFNCDVILFNNSPCNQRGPCKFRVGNIWLLSDTHFKRVVYMGEISSNDKTRQSKVLSLHREGNTAYSDRWKIAVVD